MGREIKDLSIFFDKTSYTILYKNDSLNEQLNKLKDVNIILNKEELERYFLYRLETGLHIDELREIFSTLKQSQWEYYRIFEIEEKILIVFYNGLYTSIESTSDLFFDEIAKLKNEYDEKGEDNG